MQHATLTVIRDEHAALAAMLRTLSMLLAEHRRHRHAARLRRAARDAVLHRRVPRAAAPHQGDRRCCFRGCAGAATRRSGVLDRLDREHEHGEAKIRDLEHELLAFEMMGEARRKEFETAAERYVDFYLAHMRTEEQRDPAAGRTRAAAAGLGRARRGVRGEPRPADRTRAGARVSGAVQPHRAHGAGAAWRRLTLPQRRGPQ